MKYLSEVQQYRQRYLCFSFFCQIEIKFLCPDYHWKVTQRSCGRGGWGTGRLGCKVGGGLVTTALSCLFNSEASGFIAYSQNKHFKR